MIERYKPMLNVDAKTQYIPTVIINDIEKYIDKKLNFKEIE